MCENLPKMRYLHMKNPRKTGANAQNSPYEHTNFSRALAVVPRQQYNIYNYAQNFATKDDFTCVCARKFPFKASIRHIFLVPFCL